LFYENLITSSLIAPSMEPPFQNITVAIKGSYILDRNEDIVKRVSYTYYTKKTENLVSIIENEMFPDEKKYIYSFKTVGHYTLDRIVNEIKYPYKCPQTNEGIGLFPLFLEFHGGMKTQLACVFEWILEDGLFSPFFHLEQVFVEITMRKIHYNLKSSRGKDESYLDGNLITLSNLVPLFIASALALLVANFKFLVECIGLNWRALLTDYLARSRLRFVNAFRFMRSFVSIIIGYVQCLWNATLL
jgi:hypothetical protein